MKIFDKFKKNKLIKVENNSIFDIEYPIDKSDWLQVFSACLGKVMTIQQACGEQVVKGQNWSVDFKSEIISFGESNYPIQFIGSESNLSNTWKWGWDNINGFNEKMLNLANNVKDMGSKWGLEPLYIEGFEIDENFNGHNLSIVACGISKINYCYYRIPHEGGSIFVGFSGVSDSVFSSVDLQKFITISMECIQQFEIDHKIFIESYLIWNGTQYKWENQTIIAHFNQDLYIEFEKVGEKFRISSMNTK